MEQTVHEGFKILEWLPFFQSHAFLRSTRSWHKETVAPTGRGDREDGWAPLDPSQLVPQAGRQDALHFFHDKV